jgi:hypothetical protein
MLMSFAKTIMIATRTPQYPVAGTPADTRKPQPR